jgi:hypothetical protein
MNAISNLLLGDIVCIMFIFKKKIIVSFFMLNSWISRKLKRCIVEIKTPSSETLSVPVHPLLRRFPVTLQQDVILAFKFCHFFLNIWVEDIIFDS